MKTNEMTLSADDLVREDERDDALFYRQPRLVAHLDAVALRTVEAIIGALVTERAPVILDLMASWDSHLPPALAPAEVVGLGLNAAELAANQALTARVVLDINSSPELPFEDAAFDVVLNTVSVDYLTRPREIVAEAARVLRPGGLLLVTFSDRFFPEKVVRRWRGSSETERIDYVEELFAAAQGFARPQVVISRGRPRPADDKYAGSGLPSDPIVAVYAARLGPSVTHRPAPDAVASAVERALPRDPRLAGPGSRPRRQYAAHDAPCCPRCGGALSKWEVPQTPFTEWDCEHMYICFNDACPYFVRGWTVMAAQGNRGISYRQMFEPDRRVFMPVPVPSPGALRDGIVA